MATGEEAKPSTPGKDLDEALQFRRAALLLAREVVKAEGASPVDGLAQVNLTELFGVLTCDDNVPIGRSIANRYAALAQFPHFGAAERAAYAAEEAAKRKAYLATHPAPDPETWYKCGNARCEKLVATLEEMKKCMRCESIHYCSVKCRTAAGPEHHAKHCTDSFDYELFRLLGQIRVDVDTWRKTVLQKTDLSKVGTGLVQDKETRVKYCRWVMMMPLIVHPEASAHFELDEHNQMALAARGTRNHDACTQLCMTLIMHMVQRLTSVKPGDKMPMTQRTHELAQLIVTPKKSPTGRAVMRCCCCLGPSGCDADIFLKGTSTTKDRLRLIVTGDVGCVEADGSIVGHVWWVCSPDCAMLYREALMPSILYTANYDMQKGHMRLTTDLMLGLKGFFQVGSDDVQLLAQHTAPASLVTGLS
jgi:hypothetical protein